MSEVSVTADLLPAALVATVNKMKSFLIGAEEHMATMPCLPEGEQGIQFVDQALGRWEVAYGEFEKQATELPVHLRAESKNYVRSQLHPYLLDVPFINRAYLKPRGYAGDYEMMNMLLKPTPLGDSAYSQLIHMFYVLPGIASSVRNRSDIMRDYLLVYHSDFAEQERFRILSLACGPAWEIERFLKMKPSGKIEITLLDHDDEALNYAGKRLRTVADKHGLDVELTLVKESVFKLLKQARNGDFPFEKEYFHVAYSAGIMDYLSDNICTQLIACLLHSLHRHGVFFTTNMHPHNPEKHLMEYILDWALIYRDEKQLSALSPVAANRVFTDDTGINVFLEVKPT